MNCIDVKRDGIFISKGSHIDCYINYEHKVINIQDSTGTDDSICDIIISNDNNYLAILTSLKKLIVYVLPDLQLKKSYTLPRSASKIRFGIENTNIFVADKTGDVLFYDLLNDECGTKLLGHLSLLLNVLQSNNGNYLISCDRDEKIRVSCYPNTYNIQTYCLGHKEFVNHIEWLPHDDNYLLSASGDGTIKCWDYIRGHLFCSIKTKDDISDDSLQIEFKKAMDEEGIEVDSLPIIHLSTTKLNDTSSLIAVTVHLCKNILIYKLQTSEHKVHAGLVNTIKLDSIPSCIKFFNLSLYVFDDNENNVVEYSFTESNNEIVYSITKTIKMFNDLPSTTVKKVDSEYIKVLFKRKFDNVQEYQERKRSRLEKSQ